MRLRSLGAYFQGEVYGISLCAFTFRRKDKLKRQVFLGMGIVKQGPGEENARRGTFKFIPSLGSHGLYFHPPLRQSQHRSKLEANFRRVYFLHFV